MLLVGAGGIGCEVLKNLVCCGFGSSSAARNDTTETNPNAADPIPTPERKPEIVVIDLDTIDLSNLNRQFLFRKQHIKKPKAFVAKETASQFNPSVNIDAHHASIFDKPYNVDFFESFDLVFNALDNLAARRHVNRMCIAANVPLIESGTTGFNGQVQAIRRGVVQCYDCTEKPVQKSFPICTIRSTPSQPIHCIVWAKSYLFPELFGTSEEDSTDVTVTDGDSAEEVAKLKEEAEALKNIRGLMRKSEFAQEVFDKVFRDDIERLRGMAAMWVSRQQPTALDFEQLRGGVEDLVRQGSELASQDQRVWTLQENLAVFCHSVDVLSKRQQDGESVMEFDKDDKDTLDFVASAANLRSQVFGIQMHNEFDIKQMAGNIIPAIATSNALTASLCVLEGFKILRGSQSQTNGASNHAAHGQAHSNGKTEPLLDGAKMVFLNSRATERMIMSESLMPPNPDCPVCSSVYAKLALQDDSITTLGQVVDLLKEKLGYDEFSITTDAGLAIFDPDLDDENLSKSLKELGVEAQGNGFLRVMDDSDEPKVDLALSITIQGAGNEGIEAAALQLIPSNIELPLKPKRVEEENGAASDGDDDDVVLATNGGPKRKRDADDEVEVEAAAAASKKTKIDGVETLVISDDGAIVLPD